MDEELEKIIGFRKSMVRNLGIKEYCKFKFQIIVYSIYEYIIKVFEKIISSIKNLIFKLTNKEFMKQNKEYVDILKRAEDRKKNK